MTDLSYQSTINHYQRKIDDYNREARKPSDEQSLSFKTTNIAMLQIELEHYKKLEKKRLQKLALIKECQNKFNDLKQETTRKQNQLKEETNLLNSTVQSYKNMAPTMIKGNSGKSFQDSLEIVRENTKAIQDMSSNFK